MAAVATACDSVKQCMTPATPAVTGPGFFFFQNTQRVLRGGTGVNDQWLATRSGGSDMGTKALPLPLQIAAQTVVVQTGFTDGDNARVGCLLNQLIYGGFRRVLVIRMHAD